MNCKLKLHSKGFYYQILGAVTVLRFLQTLALDGPGNFSRQEENFLQTNAQKFEKVVLAHVAACNALKCFQYNR